MNQQFAWVQHGDTLYFSRCPALKGVPTSALVKLLQGLFDQFKDHSFFILRQKIFLNYQPTDMDLGMIKVVGKRFRIELNHRIIDEHPNAVEIGQPEHDFYPLNSPILIPDTIKVGSQLPKRNWIQSLRALEKQIPVNEVLHDSHRRIVAVALDENLKILGAAAHSGVVNKTLHAEVVLVQTLYQFGLKAFPQRGIILTSQKPCLMCAGMIFEYLPHDYDGRIFFLNDHQGSKTKSGPLDRIQKVGPIEDSGLTPLENDATSPKGVSVPFG